MSIPRPILALIILIAVAAFGAAVVAAEFATHARPATHVAENNGDLRVGH